MLPALRRAQMLLRRSSTHVLKVRAGDNEVQWQMSDRIYQLSSQCTVAFQN
jgi:hypothetical protein